MKNTLLFTNAILKNHMEPVDLLVINGKYEKIGENLRQIYEGIENNNLKIIDLKGKLICEPFVESHIHLDYVYTASLPKEPTASGTLFEAIDKWSESKSTLTFDILKDRAKTAIRSQVCHGVQYIRTHVDICDPSFTALKAMLELKEELKDSVMIQIIAFPQEGYFAYPHGDELVEEALKMGCDVVGGIPHFEFTQEQGIASVKKAFEYAQKYDKLIDIHCDETDDEQSRFVEIIASEAYFTGMGKQTAASHTCAMGSYNNAYAFKMMSKFKRAGINFISCPTENCYLQGRYDTYPKRRGLTRLDELLENDINVSLGQDSISDPWYPLGNGNLIHQVDFALHLSHMMQIPQIQNGLDLISVNGAKTLQLGDEYLIKEGNPASFIVIDAPNAFEAIRNNACVFLSVKNGRILMQKEPEKVITEPIF